MGEIDRWAYIHPDLLNEITKRLHSYDDHISLGLVCKEWNLKLRSKEILWLMLPDETSKPSSFDQEEEEEINSLMHLPVTGEDTLETKVFEEKGIYHAMLPDMQMLDTLIRGSCYGWLITLTISEGKMQMIDPVTHMHFDLPPLSTFPNIIEYNQGDDEYTMWDYNDIICNLDRDGMHKVQVWKVVINSPPNNDDNKDFMAVAIYGAPRRLARFISLIAQDGTVGGIHATPPVGFKKSPYKLKYLIGCANGNILMLYSDATYQSSRGRK
ncbi:hypothetical protein PIB30_001562 [Stylosanthes scabra]|uniref:KIB1-4 beta-propeller domain-containing protein n=1 Tax=Stylosanthes scabra TaxID=79078 RepID=A0ABU6R418_9FABA|nr:hypothetical protein [Stylosanthes scabra]